MREMRLRAAHLFERGEAARERSRDNDAYWLERLPKTIDFIRDGGELDEDAMRWCRHAVELLGKNLPLVVGQLRGLSEMVDLAAREGRTLLSQASELGAAADQARTAASTLDVLALAARLRDTMRERNLL